MVIPSFNTFAKNIFVNDNNSFSVLSQISYKSEFSKGISFTGIIVSFFSREKIFNSSWKPIIKYLSSVFKLDIYFWKGVEYISLLFIKS